MTHREKLGFIEAYAADKGCRILKDEPLRLHTSVRTGGSCDLMVFAPDSETAARVYFKCKDIELYSMILGNGSNVLFTDEGFRGAVIVPEDPPGSIICDGERITASAGVKLSAVCKAALDNGLTGLEFAYGIPGTVGGAVYMNAGAYGGEIKGIVESVRAVLPSGKVNDFTADELMLGYRTSRFAHSGEIITSAVFRLERGERDLISAKMEELIKRRHDRQPLEYPSFGSAFKRPEGTYAGLVIEQSGLKGVSVGRAQISPKHANFIINLGGATSSDIIELIELTQRTVKEKTGYTLEPEVRLIPSEPVK